MRKGCKSVAKCVECQSERDLAALHADSQPQRQRSGRKEQGKEQDDDLPPNPAYNENESVQQRDAQNQVTAKCTEVCGNGLAEKSCSKICLANVYVDDASETKITSFTLRACAGTTKMEGRRARGLVVEPVERDKKYLLPL